MDITTAETTENQNTPVEKTVFDGWKVEPNGDGTQSLVMRIPYNEYTDSILVQFALREYGKWEKRRADKLAVADEKDREFIADDTEYARMVHDSVMSLILLLSYQGHSGLSHSFVMREFRRLADFKPLFPIEWDPNDWNLISEDVYGKKTYQNKTCSAVFCYDLDPNTAHYIEGKIFSDDGGRSWYTNCHSHIPIKFPFMVPDKPERVILTKEEKAEMDRKDEEEHAKWLAEHPDYEERVAKRLAEYRAKHPETACADGGGC